jgi:hypothetical protein
MQKCKISSPRECCAILREYAARSSEMMLYDHFVQNDTNKQIVILSE